MQMLDTDAFKGMVKALEVTPKRVVLCAEMHKALNQDHAVLTCTFTDFARELFITGKLERDLHAFTFDKEYDIVELHDIMKPDKLKACINEQKDAIAYGIMLKSHHLTEEDIDLSEEEVVKLIEETPKDKLVETLKAKGAKLRDGLTAMLVTKRGLSSLALIRDKGDIDLLALSDWSGNMPVHMESDSKEMAFFKELFDETKPITKSELIDILPKDSPATIEKSLEAIKEITKDPDELMAKLLKSDGHNGYQAAYAALGQLMKTPDLRRIDPDQRRALIAVFQNRINLIELSLLEDEKNAHQAPTIVQ